MNRNQVLSNLCEADKHFKNSKHKEIIKEAWILWNSNHSLKSIQQRLNQLPSDKQLVSQLIEKLKGKSVYKTLKRLGKIKNPMQEAKALSSLLTHAIISVEQGEVQYGKLFPLLLTKINEKVYKAIK